MQIQVLVKSNRRGGAQDAPTIKLRTVVSAFENLGFGEPTGAKHLVAFSYLLHTSNQRQSYVSFGPILWGDACSNLVEKKILDLHSGRILYNYQFSVRGGGGGGGGTFCSTWKSQDPVIRPYLILAHSACLCENALINCRALC